jgi:Leucine-rich repeat (LRR) protein
VKTSCLLVTANCLTDLSLISTTGKLTTLTELNLHNNQLSVLPATISSLPSLTKVSDTLSHSCL